MVILGNLFFSAGSNHLLIVVMEPKYFAQEVLVQGRQPVEGIFITVEVTFDHLGRGDLSMDYQFHSTYFGEISPE